MGDKWGTGIPIEVNAQLMERGRQRFNITCAMCHGATAAGDGITKQYGLATVVTLQDERIRKMADGEIFNTITNGKNTMMAYGPNIMVADRWAIICYLRALQRSQNTTVADVPPEHRADLDKPAETKPNQNRRPRRNERTFPRCPDAGRRIFREEPFRRVVFAPRRPRSARHRLERGRRDFVAAAAQLFVALRLRVFLHPLRRLSFSGSSSITPPMRNGP